MSKQRLASACQAWRWRWPHTTCPKPLEVRDKDRTRCSLSPPPLPRGCTRLPFTSHTKPLEVTSECRTIKLQGVLEQQGRILKCGVESSLTRHHCLLCPLNWGGGGRERERERRGQGRKQAKSLAGKKTLGCSTAPGVPNGHRWKEHIPQGSQAKSKPGRSSRTSIEATKLQLLTTS